MASLNKVLLIGNLTRPPELRYTPSGTAVADLRLAVNRNYTTQGGEKREEATFLTVVVWSKQAESCGEYLDKGSQIFVEGRLQTRDWETKDDFIKDLQNKTNKWKSGDISDVQVATFGSNTAVSRYTFTYDAELKGTHRARTVICSDTWVTGMVDG